jgi:cation:H+ antiporter
LALQSGVLAISLLLLYKGGDWLVDGSSALAILSGWSPLLVGLTIVAYGTSMPELAVSATASLQGNAGIAAGNVIGSNIANILLILGLSALIAPVAVPRRLFGRDLPILLAATALVLLFSAISFARLGAGEPYSFDRLEGVLLLGAFAVYSVYFVRLARRQSREHAKLREGKGGSVPASDHEGEESASLPEIRTKTRAGTVLAVGLGGVLLGGVALVWSASGIARQTGASDEVIGLTIVAVGTSLPELVTSVIAARKKRSGIALGNIIGSNIFNGLLILGLAASIHPLDISPSLLLDAVVMMAVTLVLVYFLRTGWKLTRWEGAILFIGFAVYMASMFIR